MRFCSRNCYSTLIKTHFGPPWTVIRSVCMFRWQTILTRLSPPSQKTIYNFKLVFGHTTKHMKHDRSCDIEIWNPRLKMSHSGCTLVRHFQLWVHHISMSTHYLYFISRVELVWRDWLQQFCLVNIDDYRTHKKHLLYCFTLFHFMLDGGQFNVTYLCLRRPMGGGGICVFVVSVRLCVRACTCFILLC